MRLTRFRRLLAIVASTSLLVTVVVSALAVIGSRLWHNAATAEDMPLAPLTSSLQEGSVVYADNGTTVLGVFQASIYRKPVPLNQISNVLVSAVLDTEDHRFFLHGGFDIPSTVRALADDTSGAGLQGGSTITQQLVKQLYLTPEQTVSRKIKEAVIADRLTREYSKDQILDTYLNTIYLGNGAYGVEAAANVYFGEHASQLNLPQAALLAGLIQDPSGYDPILEAAAARDRRDQVLSRMVHYDDVTQVAANKANAVPLPTAIVKQPTQGDGITNYYLQAVENQLLGSNSPLGTTYEQRYQALFEGGLKIYTSLDPTIQNDAEQAVAEDTPRNTGGFEEAMVAIDPQTGQVEAMVGGPGTTSANSGDFNVITQGTRQPGSGFKIFTLLAALEHGYSIYDTLDGQGPCAIDFPGDDDLASHPARNDEGGGGVMTLLSATANSVNCAFIRLAHEVGLQNVTNMARSLGITTPIQQVPSMVIGSQAVHPIEIAAAYATVADGGVYHAPSFINHIVDRTGATIFNGIDPGHRVIPAWIAAEAAVAFQAVVEYGTGTAAALYTRPVAGKTGTTDNNQDAWFNGFTPQLEATVWMGNVQAEVPMYDVGGIAVYGGTYPAETWHTFAAAALAGQPVIDFPSLDYASLPASKYVTSSSLVEADVLDHNGVKYVPYYPYYLLPGQTPPTTATTSPPTSVPSGGGPPSGAPPTGAPPTGGGNGHGGGNGKGGGNGGTGPGGH